MNLQADMSCDKHKLKMNYSAAKGRRSQRQAAPPSPIAHIFSQNSSQSGVVGSISVGATVIVGEVDVIVVVGVDGEVAVWVVVGAVVGADDGFVAAVFAGVENSVVLFDGTGVVVAGVDNGTGVVAIEEDVVESAEVEFGIAVSAIVEFIGGNTVVNDSDESDSSSSVFSCISSSSRVVTSFVVSSSNDVAAVALSVIFDSLVASLGSVCVEAVGLTTIVSLSGCSSIQIAFAQRKQPRGERNLLTQN